MAFRYTPKRLEKAYKALGDTEEVNVLRAHIDALEHRVDRFYKCATLHLHGRDNSEEGREGLTRLVTYEKEFQDTVEAEELAELEASASNAVATIVIAGGL